MENKSSFCDRLKSAMSIRRMSQRDLVEKTGLSKSRISQYVNGVYVAKQDGIYLLSKALDVSETWLMGYDVPMERPAPQQDNIFDIPGIMPLPKTYMVPLLGTIACGEPILAEQNIVDHVPVPETVKAADFALTCKGDSMIGARIYDGDIVYIRKQSDVDDGEIAAVLIDNEATLKRVFKMPGRLQLRAENPAFPPINLEGEELETVRILGKALAFVGPVK